MMKKPEKKEGSAARGRLNILAVGVVLLSAVIVLRLWNLQIVHGPEYAAQSDDNRLKFEFLKAPARHYLRPRPQSRPCRHPPRVRPDARSSRLRRPPWGQPARGRDHRHRPRRNAANRRSHREGQKSALQAHPDQAKHHKDRTPPNRRNVLPIAGRLYRGPPATPLSLRKDRRTTARLHRRNQRGRTRAEGRRIQDGRPHRPQRHRTDIRESPPRARWATVRRRVQRQRTAAPHG